MMPAGASLSTSGAKGLGRLWSQNSPAVIALCWPRAPGPPSQFRVPAACWLVHQWRQGSGLDRLTRCPRSALWTALLLWLQSYLTQADTPYLDQ